MSSLKPRVSFALNFASYFSVMTHNSSEIFWLKHYMLGKKKAHQSITFQNFECFNESSHNSSCHFWNNKVKVYSNFALLFSVIKITPLYFFLSQTFILWTKKAHRSENLRLFSGWVNIHQIPHAMFEITGQFFVKFCITLQCHER